MTHITEPTNVDTRIRSSTDVRVNAMFACSFSSLIARNAMISRASLTNALMTATPEKLSCAMSDRRENAACRLSHFLVITRPTSVLAAISSAIGIMDSTVISGSMRHIRYTAMPPKSSASNVIISPKLKQSSIVTRSLVNRLIRSPTLFF